MTRRLRGNGRLWLAVAMAQVLGALAVPASTSARSVGEPELKVAILGKIAEFITWPRESALDNKDRPFELVVLGATDLAASFDRYYRQQKATIAGHRVFLRHTTDPAEVGKPHLLFVGADFSDRLDEVLVAVGSAATVTAADTEGFASRGIAVNLYVSNGRIRFEVSRRALKRQGLKASYRLLGLARLIEDQQARR